MTNVEKLHQEKVLDKEKLNTAQINAINSLSEAEINHMISISKKLKGKLDESDHDITGMPF